MANYRVQSDTGLRPEPITPVAAPVDAFVHTDAGNQLAQLASGLSQLNPALQRFTGVVAEKVDTEQQAAGEAAARKMSDAGQKASDLVKSGALPRGANPFFVAGFKEQVGRVTADRWQSDLTTAIATNVANGGKLAMSTDIRDFDEFVNQQRQKWLADNVGDNRDQFFETGFGHRSDAYLTEARQSFASDMAKRIEENAENIHYQEVYNHVLSNIDKKFTPEQIAADITELNNNNVQHLGYDGAMVNRQTMKAVISAALNRATIGDPNAAAYLDILKGVQGKNGSLATTSYGSQALVQARDQINRTLFEANQREHTQQAEKREALTRTTMQGAVQALMKDRHADLTPFATALEQGGVPEAAVQLTSLQQNINELTFHTDQAQKQKLFSDIWANPGSVTPETIVGWMNRGKIDVQDASFLQQQLAEQRRVTKEQSNDIFSDFEFQRTLSDMQGRFANPLGIVKGEDADRSDYAKAMLMHDWVQYREGDGAKATPEEKIQWLQKNAQSIVAYERGTNGLTMNPATKPALGNTDWNKDKVVTSDDLGRIRGELLHGTVSDATMALFARLGITTPAQQAAFLRAQMQLLGVKSDTTATKKP